MPAIATGLAAIWVVAAGAPAFADQVRQQEWWLSTLHVRQAWQASRGAGITVAVLSDGVSTAQADIAGTVTTGPDYTGTAQTTGPFFAQQGTAIASLIAGRGNGARHASGILGVAPRSRILSVRVTLDPADTALNSATVGAGLPGAIAQGIRYAVAHHARVIELPQDPGEPDPAVVAAIPLQHNPDGTMATHPLQTAGITAAAGGSAAEKAAVAYALHKGVVLVAPAGDNAEGTDAVSYPAAYRGVISVGAFSQAFTRAPYSSHQPYVTLTAAGEGVIAARADGTYADVSSTNAASAMVAGVAALIRSRYPGLTPAQVSRALTTSTVVKPGRASAAGSGAGTVDAQRALLAAAAIAAPPDSRAGAGAQAFTSPAAPDASPVSSNALAPRVLRAAAIAAAVLIVLLLAVFSYAAAARRRARRRRPSTAQWASAQNAYSPYGPADADKMLEFFAAPHSEPATAAGPFQQFQAGQLSGAGFGSGPAADTGAGTEAGSAADGPVGAWVPLGGSARGSRAPVSGTPPWEPAAKPDSELPWASVPGPAPGAASRASAAARRPADRDDSIWPAADGPAAAAAASDSMASSEWANLVPSPDAPAAFTAGTGYGDMPGADAGRGDAPGSATAGGGSPAPEAVGSGSGGRRSPWADGSAPRSPSGSDWDLPDSEPDTAVQAAADSGWLSGSEPPRTPATSAGGWTPPEGEDRWEMPASPASSSGWDLPRRGESWEPAEPEAAASAPAEASEPDMHWLPAAAGTDRWASAEPPDAGQRASAADQSEARWQLSPAGSAPDEPAAPASPSWESAPSSPSWDAASASPSWDASPSSRSWDSAPAGAPWDASPASTSPGSAPANAPWDAASPSTPWDAAPASTSGDPASASAPWDAAPASKNPEAAPASTRWDSTSAAEPSEAAPASTPWDAAPGQPGWDRAAEQDWRPAAEPRWGTARRDAPPQGPAAGGTAGARRTPDWGQTPDDATPAADSPPDGGWPSASSDALGWGTAAASAAAAAKAAASTPWEPAAEPPGWGSAAPAAPSAAAATDEDGPARQRFAWRPSAQTENFPAITDD
jgi:hypothetical protein